VRRKDRELVKKGLRKIYDAKTLPKARAAARRFASKWERQYRRWSRPSCHWSSVLYYRFYQSMTAPLGSMPPSRAQGAGAPVPMLVVGLP
jgi:hypothetical protein